MFTGSSIKCVPCSHMEWSSVCGGVCIRNRHSKRSHIQHDILFFACKMNEIELL